MANIRPDGSLKIWVNNIPIITGKSMIAPSALDLGKINNSPPIISAKATIGNNHFICMKAAINLIKLSDISLGIGM